jgi:hypothetical protein
MPLINTRGGLYFMDNDNIYGNDHRPRVRSGHPPPMPKYPWSERGRRILSRNRTQARTPANAPTTTVSAVRAAAENIGTDIAMEMLQAIEAQESIIR